MERHHFLLRRLHSLTGIVPIGLFLVMHLTTNSTILWGAFNTRIDGEGFDRRVGTFQKEVEFINELPLLLLIEITLWGAIAFHSVLGVYYATSGKGNTGAYRYQSNLRYSLQRWTGYLGFLFIVYHIATLRWGWSFLVPGGTEWSHHFAASTLAAALRGGDEGFTALGVAVSLFYFLGVTALVFHFANGLWTAAITWGLTVTVTAQKRWGYACTAIGAGLMVAGWASVVGFAALDPAEARQVEMSLHGEVPTDGGEAEARSMDVSSRGGDTIEHSGGQH